ncbi:MAG: hypothetical protein F6K08_27140 [Okeania sp. SIO1H6]|nr:hypothetical protein [Okeania sp. SIO1H6]
MGIAIVEISICIENRVADEKVLNSFFQGIVEDYCEKFDELIHSRREGNGHRERYKKLLKLKDDWNVNKEAT